MANVKIEVHERRSKTPAHLLQQGDWILSDSGAIGVVTEMPIDTFTKDPIVTFVSKEGCVYHSEWRDEATLVKVSIVAEPIGQRGSE